MEQHLFRIAQEEREPLFPPVDAEVSGEDGTNHGGTDQVGPRFAADDQILLTVERAKEILLGQKSLSARDAVHLAVMRIHSIRRILSFDRGFDGVPGITRLS